MSDPLLDRLERLEAANATLQREVAELRVQIDHARAGGFRSIRDHRKCPACGSGSLLHVRRAKDATYGAPVDLAITHQFSNWKGTKMHGPIELFACRGCGLIEYHVIDFEGVVADGEHVVAIEPEPDQPAGPFR